MRKKLPIGLDSFEKMRTNDFYYVDKTLFIKELLENWGEVNQFTRPRRFGKSLNMSMLKSFFEVGGDPALFDDLKISQEKELFAKYQGKFPVISISLKGVDGRSFFSASAALRTIIGSEAMRFQYLKESEKLSNEEKEAYRRLIQIGSGEGGLYAMTEEVAAASLKVLSQLLAKHCGQKAILLVDEYDVPLDKAFQAGYYEEMVDLIRNLLGNVLKTNDSLFFAVLTGCLRISKESIFTGLNNLKIHTISDVRYDEFFGFTDGDVEELLEYYGLPAYKEAVRAWYDGYRFGNTDVYCPWDVINYCDELLADPSTMPKNYWANTSGNDLIRRLLRQANLSVKDEVEELLGGGKVTKRVKQELTYREIDESDENLWSVLYATGYLTGKQVGQADADLFQLWIPNGEIRKLFANLVEEWFQETGAGRFRSDQPFLRGLPSGGCGGYPGNAPGLPVGFYQRAGHGGAKEPERKLLPRNAFGPFEEPGKLGGQIQR